MDARIRKVNIHDSLLFGFLLIIVLLIGYQLTIDGGGPCGVFHDDGIYVSTAKALAEGKGYRLINLPGSPAQTKYPILYPVLLAMIWKASPDFPQNIFFLKMPSLIMAALAVAFCYLYLIRYIRCSRLIAFSSCLVCCTTPLFLFFATNTLSEIFFLFLVLFSLWALEIRNRISSFSRISDFFVGLLLSLPFLCRSIGVALIISAIIICYRRKTPAFWLTLGAIMPVIPWLLWVLYSLFAFEHDFLRGYYVDYWGWWRKFGLSSMASVFFINIFYFLDGVNRLVFSGFYGILNPTNVNLGWFILIAFFVGFLFLLGFWKNIQRNEFLSWFLVGYFVISFLWPWPPARFIVVILPFVICYMLLGISEVFHKVASSHVLKAIGVCIIVLVVTTNLLLVYRNLEIQDRTGYPQTPLREGSVYWTSYEGLFNWVKEHSSPNDVIASGLDPMVYLYTGRRSFRPFVGNPASLFYGENFPALGTVRDLVSILRAYGPKYLIHTPMPGYSEERPFRSLLEDLLKECPGALNTVYLGSDNRFKVFSVHFGSDLE